MYAIYETPGLIGDGSYPLSADGMRRGEVERATVGNPGPVIAAWRTREAAEHAMEQLTRLHSDQSPSVYAGLSVGPAPVECRHYDGLHEWMD